MIIIDILSQITNNNNDLPPAFSGLLIIALSSGFFWFVNRFVNKIDKTFDKLEEKVETSLNKVNETMNHIMQQITNLEARITNLEKPKGRR